MEDSKACTKCGQIADKTSELCNKCYKRAYNLAAVKRYQAKNPEVKGAWAKANKERWANYLKVWRQQNPEKSAEYSKRSRQKNKESARESWRKYAQKNPEYVRYKSAKRRAVAKENGSFYISKRQLKKLYSLPCFYCGAKAEHLDHVVPLSRGGQHSIGNLVPACATCNLHKNDRFITEWKMSMRSEILEKEGKHNARFIR